MPFGFFILSDLHLFQETAPLNPCFILAAGLSSYFRSSRCFVYYETFDYAILSFILKLIKDKSRALPKVPTYFNETTTSTSNLLSLSDVLLLFYYYSQEIYLLMSRCYLFYNYKHRYFLCIIIYFISIKFQKLVDVIE